MAVNINLNPISITKNDRSKCTLDQRYVALLQFNNLNSFNDVRKSDTTQGL